MKRTFALTFSAIIAAMSVALMAIGGIVPFGLYAFPFLAGVLTVAVVIEINIGWACAVFAVTSGLSILVCANKETALVYIIFAGYYPIVKALFDKIKPRVLSFLPKLALFNAAAIGEYYFAIYVLGVPEETFHIFNINFPLILLLIGNVVFVLYDIALSLSIQNYYRRLHPVFRKWKQ